MAGAVDQLDLLDYPNTPGWRDRETSIEAAEELAGSVTDLRQTVLADIKSAGAYGRTADEVATRTGIDRLTVRPRVTELGNLNLIHDGGQRRPNESGRKAIVWIAGAKQQEGTQT
jgi:hypothetical protein